VNRIALFFVLYYDIINKETRYQCDCA